MSIKKAPKLLPDDMNALWAAETRCHELIYNLFILRCREPFMDDVLPDMQILSYSGATGRDIASQDWSKHPLGEIRHWPLALRISLANMLSSGFPSYISWGKELYTFYNQAYAPSLGSKVSFGQGCPLTELWPEVAETARSIADQALAGTTSYFEDMPFMLNRYGQPEQAYFTFSYSPVCDEYGVIGGILATAVDTTEKVVAPTRLKESEERYRLALEASGNIGTWAVDPETNHGFMDEHVVNIFEVDPDISREGSVLDYYTRLIHPEDRTRVEQAIARSLETGSAYDIDYRILQESGKIVWVSVKGKMFTNTESGKKLLAGVIVDITHRKEIEDTLREGNQHRDEFLAMLAHELRNPLAPISAAAHLLKMDGLDRDQIRQTSDIIVRQVGHMTGLVDDLLDVSRVTRGLASIEKAPVEIRHIIADAVEQVAPLFQSRRQQLNLNLAPALTVVAVDKKRIVQVVANILNNAAKYTPEGGHITVKTQRHLGQVKLDVVDDGLGMSPELAIRVFDLFSQAYVTPDRSSGGLGLGLALAKSLVELHGGTVSCSSEGLGKGSQFTILLPSVDTEHKQDEFQAKLTQLRSIASKLRIMIVDDNEDAATMLGMLLSAMNYDVQIEHGARQALSRANIEKPDVCLLDIGLPEIDGNELAQRLRRLPGMRDVVLIAITGYGQEGDRKNSLAAGFDHHFVKPVDMIALASVLEKLVNEVSH